MFEIDALHLIRDAEIEILARRLPTSAKILEIGAGTGYQARALAAQGFDVTAVDVPESDFIGNSLCPIIRYDGRRLPFADATFDSVLSSNVLEHVPHLNELLTETCRVLRPGGVCVHAMPSSTWRLWTSLTGFVDVWPFLWIALSGGTYGITAISHGIASRLLPLPHGVNGNALTELWTFSRRRWHRTFRRAGFDVVTAEPMGLFYTGHMVLGRRWSIASRRRASRWLGSACIAYVVQPRATS